MKTDSVRRLKALAQLFSQLWRVVWTYQTVAHRDELSTTSNRYGSPAHPKGASTPASFRSIVTLGLIRCISDRIGSAHMTVLDVSGAYGRTALEIADLLPEEFSLKWTVLEKSGFNFGSGKEMLRTKNLELLFQTPHSLRHDLGRKSVDLICFIGSLSDIPTPENRSLVKNCTPRFIVVQRYPSAVTTRTILRRFPGAGRDFEVLLDVRDLDLRFQVYQRVVQLEGEPLPPDKRAVVGLPNSIDALFQLESDMCK